MKNTQNVELVTQIEATILRKKTVLNLFHNTTSPELIDACIYEMKSLDSLHSYLIKQMQSV